MDTIKYMLGVSPKKGSNEDPISGVQGDTSKSEPFDAGNKEPESTLDKTNKTEITEHEPAKPTGQMITNKEVTENESVAPAVAPAPAPAPAPASAPASTESKTEESGPSDTAGADPAPADTTAQQNDVRDPEDPNTHPDMEKKVEVNPEDKPVNEAALKEPGPKPLADLAKEHGGDAGHVSDQPASTRHGNPGVPPTGSFETSGSDQDGPKKYESKGTGELYIKSTGLKADGGDFDATKPGAGREADRLLDQMGVKGDAKDFTSTKSESSDKLDKASSKISENGAAKRSLKQKIKGKLHVH